MNVIQKVKEAIKQDNLIPAGTDVFVGVSGGADSVALLHILHRLGFTLTAAHLNHAIRGAEADADEQFVKELCTKLGVECISSKDDVPALAAKKGISLEMAAREARHEFFRSLIPDRPPSPRLQRTSRPLTPVVCLAHHADDQLETFFLRATRGTGLVGLGGMRPFHCLEELKGAGSAGFQGSDSLLICRPMLGIRRSEISQWVDAEGLEWHEDASNADETIPRNLVRHQILPTLGKINERAAENILRTMGILRDEEDHPARAAARRTARDRLIEVGVNPTFTAVEKFIEFSAKKKGTQFLDLEGVRLVNEYGTLRVDLESCTPTQSVRMEEGIGILRGPWEASVSLKKIAGRDVAVRTPLPGDRMTPYGMGGSKKLQDIFTDLKIPKAQRAAWPVVGCGSEIIWLPGYRIACGWELSGDTEPALHLFCET